MTLEYVSTDTKLKNAGATIWWKLTSGVDRDLLDQELSIHGVPQAERFIPDFPSSEVLLRRAVRSVREARLLVRPLRGRNGWALVQEHATDKVMQHATIATVHLNQIGRIEFKPTNEWMATLDEINVVKDAILDAYYRLGHTLTQGEMSRWFVDQVRHLGAVPLRESGGIYYIPPRSVARWEALAGALVRACDARAYFQPTFKTNAGFDGLLEAIFDSITAEGEALVGKIHGLLESPDKDPGKRALQTRTDKCDAFLNKVSEYEIILGRSLTDLREQISGIKGDISVAMFNLDDEE